MNFEKLAEPFSPNEIHWRVGQAGKKGNGQIWCKVMAYIDSRCIMNRLDEVAGPGNWRNEFMPIPTGGMLCGISLLIDGQWVTKWDGADNSDIEATKGGISDAMKRAAVQWGIGRYLYGIKESWAEISDNGKFYANCKIKVNGKEEWVSFHWNPPSLPDWAMPPKASGNTKVSSKREPEPEEPPKQTKQTKAGERRSIETVPEEHRPYCIQVEHEINHEVNTEAQLEIIAGLLKNKPEEVRSYIRPLYAAKLAIIKGNQQNAA